MPHVIEQLKPEQIDRAVAQANCVVFDFYLTLSSDLFFRPLGESVLSRIQPLLWGDDQQLLDRWMSGQMNASEISHYLSQHLELSAAEIEAGLRSGCQKLVLNEAVWAFAKAVRQAGKRTALVTINMDIFSEEVVPSLGLDQVFEVIVNSADAGHLDKVHLWPIAFEALGGGIGYADSFLIEDGLDPPAKFAAAGGKAYQYTDDGSFEAWLTEQVGQ